MNLPPALQESVSSSCHLHGADSEDGPSAPHSPSRTSRLRIGLLFLGLSVLFYSPIVSGQRTFPDGDFTHHFLPFALFQQQEISAGRLPLWNPYTYSGHPFLADVQAAVFYPVSNLFLTLTLGSAEPATRLYVLELEAVLHTALGGYFLFLLLWRLTGSAPGSLLGGIAFAFSGYLTGYPPLQLAVLRTAIWLPLVMWLLLEAVDRNSRWRWWVGAGSAYACAFLAGHPQTFMLLSYVTIAWLILLVIVRFRDGRQLYIHSVPLSHREALVGVGAFFLTAIGLTAAQWIPSLEFMRQSVRANVDYTFVSGGFPLQDTWQILLPGVLTQYSPLYVGIASIGLVLLTVPAVFAGSANRQSTAAHGFAPFPSPAAIIVFLFVTGLVGLLAAYGDNAFLFPVLYHFAPGWNLFRGQERAAYVAAFSLSALAGYGLAFAPILRPRIRQRVALVYLALVSGTVFSFGMLWQLLGRSAIGNGEYLVVTALTVLLSSAVAVTLWLPGWSKRRAAVCVGLVLSNLVLVNAATNVAPFSPARKSILAPEMIALRSANDELGNAAQGLSHRAYNEYRVYNDYGIRLEIEDVWGSSPLRLANYATLFEEFPLDRMWRLTGVAHVLTWRRELFVPSELLAEYPQAEDTTYLHRLNQHYPRAWFVDTVRVTDDEGTRRQLADHMVDLDTVAYVSGAAATFDLSNGGENQTRVQMDQIAPGHLHITTESEHTGFLVISENWMPGWRVSRPLCRVPAGGSESAQDAACQALGDLATRLGLFAPIRTNLSFVGIVVPPGTASFDLIYRPASVLWGLSVTGLTLAVLVGLVVTQFLRDRRRNGL